MDEQMQESYLVGLGFKLDTKEYDEYLKKLKDLDAQQAKIDKQDQKNAAQNKSAEAPRKKKLDDAKKEIDLMKGAEQTGRSLSKVLTEIAQGNPFGALMSGAQGAGAFMDLMKSLEEATHIKIGGTSVENPMRKAQPSSAAQPTGTANPTQTVEQTAAPSTSPQTPAPEEKRTSNTGGSMAKSLVKEVASAKAPAGAAVEDAALSAGMTGGEAGGAAAGGGAAGAAAVVGVGASVALVAVGVVAAITAITVAAYNLGDSLADANTNIETMSRRLWISDESAWKLNTTLKAMGKTVADLDDIALNPVLRQQFDDLQAYQDKLNSSLPSDFSKQSEKWSTSVGEAGQKLSVAVQLMGKLVGYNLQKTLAKPFEDALNWLAKIIEGWDRLLGAVPDTANTSTTDASDPQKAKTGTTGYNVYKSSDGGSLFAPQTSSYSNTSNNTASNIVIQPHIEMHTATTDAKGVADETFAAFGSVGNYAAIIQTVQSQNR